MDETNKLIADEQNDYIAKNNQLEEELVEINYDIVTQSEHDSFLEHVESLEGYELDDIMDILNKDIEE